MSNAIVSLSGGQDSATCLAWARKHFRKIYAISFNYGQRHSRELECASILCEIAQVENHFCINVENLFKEISVNTSSMIDANKDVNDSHHLFQNMPSTFVPFRNLFLLSFAAAKGLEFGVFNIVTGICQTDYSGYADCRENFRESLEKTLSLAIDSKIRIHAPLMFKSKKETVELMKQLGSLDWYKYTHTCYNGKFPPCGNCPSCKLREKGFSEAGIKDPLMEEDKR